MLKRVLSILLSVCIFLSVFPVFLTSASAAEQAIANPLFPIADLQKHVWHAATYLKINGKPGHINASYSAVDITARGCSSKGKPVYAVEDGVVRNVTASNGEVHIQHSKPLVTTDGYMFESWLSTYAHMSDINVKKNQSVKRGDLLGYVNEVGNASGPHLHFALNAGTNPFPSTKNYSISPYYVKWDCWGADQNLKWEVGGNENPGGNEKLRDWKPSMVWGAVPYNPQPPEKPASVWTSAADIAAGGTVQVSWSAVSSSIGGYTVSLVDASGVQRSVWTTTGTSMTVPLEEGKWYFNVSAYNNVGSSDAKSSGSVTAHAPVKVTFQDWDGSLLEMQTVPYGGNAARAKTPSRSGHTFAGWDHSLSGLTQDTVITALYDINYYLVNFYDQDNHILSSKRVAYGSDAQVPADPTPPAGYVFMGWDREFTNVTGNLSVYPVFVWENTDFPVIAQIQSAAPDLSGNGYNIQVSLQNYPNDITRGRLVAALKTSAEKMAASSVTQFSLSANGSQTFSIYIPYDRQAATVEVNVVALVGNERTGVPLAKAVSQTISYDWSGWQTEQPSGSVEMETKTEYRYADKEYTQSAASSLSGWTQYNATTSWGDWGSWSGWSDSQINAYQTSTMERKVQTRTVVIGTQYQYYHYRHNTTKNTWPYWVSGCGDIHYCGEYAGQTWIDYPLEIKGYSNANGTAMYKGYCPTCGFVTNFYNETTRDVTKTQWQYSDRYLNTTYHYWRWCEFSDWSSSPVSATADRQVETRTLYRYRTTTLEEDQTGTARVLSGTVGSEYAGKSATVMIYKGKNSDPTEAQLEYIAQTTLDDMGGYSFEYIPKDDPSITTGDFTILLGIEGATSPIYIDTILAPQATWIVTFINADGTVLSTQQVPDGFNAAVPDEIPQMEGHTFAGWDRSVSHITADTVISALFEKISYQVIFLDWDAQSVDVVEFQYGDGLTLPDAAVRPGYRFAGWGAEAGTAVTGNMFLIAQYEPETYTATFMNPDGTVMYRVSDVTYGQNILSVAPTLTKAGMVFDGWENLDSLGYMTQDVILTPRFIYPETVTTPTIQQVNKPAAVSLASGSPVTYLELDSATEGAEIYYSIISIDSLEGCMEVLYEFTEKDGSDIGIANGTLYTDPVSLEPGNILVCQAFAEEKNESAQALYVYPEEYTIYYDMNGGTGEIQAQQIQSGMGTNLSTVIPVKSGYVFQGWAQTPDAIQAEFQPGEHYTGEQELALYAVWTNEPVIHAAYVSSSTDVALYTVSVAPVQSGVLIAAGYQDNRLVDAVILNYTGGTIQVNLPSEADRVTFFFLDNLQNARPLANSFSLTPGEPT